MLNSQVEKIIEVAKADVGYLEKKSNAQLEDKTANAGDGNWTKHGQWYGMNGVPWCAEAVSYWANKAGVSTDIIPKHASCSAGISWFKQKGRWHTRIGYTPSNGDIIYFTHNGKDAAHVGLVYKVDTSTVYTIEGNTSNAAELIDNGGTVALKQYRLTSAKILGYGNPAYVDEIAEYKAVIQSHVKFSNPDAVFTLTDKSPYAKDLYRKWAESYK